MIKTPAVAAAVKARRKPKQLKLKLGRPRKKRVRLPTVAEVRGILREPSDDPR